MWAMPICKSSSQCRCVWTHQEAARPANFESKYDLGVDETSFEGDEVQFLKKKITRQSFGYTVKMNEK